MKPVLMRTFGLALACLFLSASTFAQLPKINKPKLPTAGVPKSVPGTQAKTTPSSVASSDSYGSGKRTNHSSGLFANCSDYFYAMQNRDTAVRYLGKLETILNQPTISYPTLKTVLQEIEGSLYRVKIDDPECDRSKFEAKYAPLETKADEQMALYDKTTALAEQMRDQFWVEKEAKKPSLLSFRTANGSHKECYCQKKEGKTYQDFLALQSEYKATLAQMKGFTNPKFDEQVKEMETCQKNGNNYAIWAAQDQFGPLVKEFEKNHKAEKPEEVIKRCSSYVAALERIESDYSLSLGNDAKQAISAAKNQSNEVKAEAERYISSGEHKSYMEKVHAEKIAKVFLPAAEGKNANLEASAMNFIKSKDWEAIKKSDSKPVTTYKAVLVNAQAYVEKTDLGVPKWKYYELWVSYKAQDGKCYRVQVFANYTYLGGGTYETTPNFGLGWVDEMAPANVMK